MWAIRLCRLYQTITITANFTKPRIYSTPKPPSLNCWQASCLAPFRVVYYRHIILTVTNTQLSALQWRQSTFYTEISKIQCHKRQTFLPCWEESNRGRFLSGNLGGLKRGWPKGKAETLMLIIVPAKIFYLKKSFLVLCLSGITLSHSSNV